MTILFWKQIHFYMTFAFSESLLPVLAVWLLNSEYKQRKNHMCAYARAHTHMKPWKHKIWMHLYTTEADKEMY